MQIPLTKHLLQFILLLYPCFKESHFTYGFGSNGEDDDSDCIFAYYSFVQHLVYYLETVPQFYSALIENNGNSAPTLL